VGFTEQQARRVIAFVDTVRLRIVEVHWGQSVPPDLSVVAAFALVSPSRLRPPTELLLCLTSRASQAPVVA
jgi:hypothetical protein